MSAWQKKVILRHGSIEGVSNHTGEVGWRNNEFLLLVNILGINKANLQSKVSKEGACVKECMYTKRMGEFTATQKREAMDKAKG